MNHKKLTWLILAAVLVILAVWTAWGNSALIVSDIKIKSENLPIAFEGFKIAHVSDLHNAQMGKDNEKLIKMLEQQKPDIIAVTGDLIDSSNTNIDIALSFIAKAVSIAPVYYVTGNHEARARDAYKKLEYGMESLGVNVLHNDMKYIQKDGQKIQIIGVDDPSFNNVYSIGNELKRLNDENAYTVLLSHRPELFREYVESEIDLTLSGHAHGGQFRLPFVGGIIAPNQGLFPEYDSGLYAEESTNMVVSRGIGNSILPFRFNNRPEIVMITLAAI
ncbi:MAG: metallophosphoesterase [Clostridia bacterium]|nr:metallophosphoesterase [Clostridia bacterium]